MVYTGRLQSYEDIFSKNSRSSDNLAERTEQIIFFPELVRVTIYVLWFFYACPLFSCLQNDRRPTFLTIAATLLT